jgi:hypothetical protein
MISTFRHEVEEDEIFWVILQRVVVIYYRRFGTTIGPITSVRNYRYLLRINPEERISQIAVCLYYIGIL